MNCNIIPSYETRQQKKNYERTNQNPNPSPSPSPPFPLTSFVYNAASTSGPTLFAKTSLSVLDTSAGECSLSIIRVNVG